MKSLQDDIRLQQDCQTVNLKPILIENFFFMPNWFLDAIVKGLKMTKSWSFGETRMLPLAKGRKKSFSFQFLKQKHGNY
jgi:hypothetical protein